MENPQANSILEIIDHVTANLVHMFDSKNNDLDEDDPWSYILASTAFVVQKTYYTTLQSTPCHMVFGCDIILNTPFIADWEDISMCERKIIEKTNLKIKPANRKHIEYEIKY